MNDSSVDEIQVLQQQLDLAKRELERMEKIKPLAIVASSVVHDIRNSLGIISSTAQFVLHKLNPPDRDKQAWELVQRNVESIQTILKSYLNLARQAETKSESVSINEIAARICGFIDAQAKRHNVRVEKNLAEDLPEILVNVPALEASILNVALNAIEAMGNGGTLKITSRKASKEGMVVLEVQDNGSGIPAAIRDKIFAPFFTMKKDGTGMGLYSAKLTAENNHGTLHFESEEGKGTTMIFHLPSQLPEK